MMKIIRTLLLIASLLLAIATCVTYFSSYVEPDKLRTIVLIQYAFPYLWLLNSLVFLGYLFLDRSWRIIIPVTASIITLGGARSVFNISGSEKISQEKKSVKVLTYNVHYLENTKPDSMAAFLNEQNADIICLQEASEQNLNKLQPFLKQYPYNTAHKIKKAAAISGHQQALFSKYPIKIIKVGEGTEPFLQGVEIEIKGKKLKVFNCHLASIGLLKDQIKVFDPSQLPDQNKSNVKKQLGTTRTKMNDAYHRRQEQVQNLSLAIQKTNTPLLICGDFNDTPISYTYQTMRKQGMKDSFLEAGFGLGNTYNGDLPPIRIDYVWHTDDMEAVEYTESRVTFSDHFPVTVTLRLE